MSISQSSGTLKWEEWPGMINPSTQVVRRIAASWAMRPWLKTNQRISALYSQIRLCTLVIPEAEAGGFLQCRDYRMSTRPGRAVLQCRVLVK